MAWGRRKDPIRDLSPEVQSRIDRLYFGSPEFVAWFRRNREGKELGHQGRVLYHYCLPQHRALTALMMRLIAQESPPEDPVERAARNAVTDDEDPDALPF